jgi:hypothetical protein
MVTGMAVDLGDTSNCPTAEVCAVCRNPVPDRRVWTADSQVGVMCLTLCDACQILGPPRMGIPDAVRAVMRHCEHLGVTIDEMAALIEAETE